MKIRILIAIVATLVSFQVATAEVLTLNQCVDLALKNNLSVQSARNAFATSQAQTYTAWGSILPSISISTSANRNWPGAFDVNISKKRTDSYSGALNFSVTYGGLGLGTYSNFKRLYHSKNSSFYGLSSAQSNIIQQIKADYFGVVRAKSLVGVANNAVKRDQEGLRVAQSRYDLGAASMSDVLKARVQLGNDQLDSVTQANSYQLALVTLAFDMGVDVGRGVEIDENLPTPQFNMSFDDALDEALKNNPDLRKVQFDYEVAKDLKKSAYSSLLPDISLGLTHRTSVTQSSDLFNFKEPDASYGLSATLSFNIFNGFGDYAAIKKASGDALTSGENLYTTRNNVALAVKQAFLSLAQAQGAKQLSDESVASAQEDLNLVKEKYSLGAATILDLLTAEASLTQAQQNQVQASYQYNIAISQVERALGK
jgi:outer membrane protein